MDENKIPGPFDEFWKDIKEAINLVETTDNGLSKKEQDAMKVKATAFEEGNAEKDMRPDRPGLLELVDPFLFCYIDGVTKYTPTADQTPLKFNDENYSKKYQLLPSEFFVDKSTKKVKATSYINNIDPRTHRTLYESIEMIVEKAVPHFENVLGGLMQISGKNTQIDLSGRSLQIVVSMKSVYLTPDSNPKYGGSDWHTEGLKNEGIVASAVYYFDVSNISESKLEFKVQVNGRKGHFRQLGHITAESNRMVVFPNIYEHVVRPFELKDKSKPGHRKILTLFLVDPNTKIISTANVAPQQSSWYPITASNTSELFQGVQDNSESVGTITLDVAKAFRDEARAERRSETIKPIVDNDQAPTTRKRRAPRRPSRRRRSRRAD